MTSHSQVPSNHVIVHPGFVEDNTPLNDQQIAVEVQQDVNLRRGADLLLARTDVDPNRLAYIGHSCDGSAGGFLSGIEKRFKAFVIMAGDLSFEIDKKTKSFQEYRQKIGPDKFDTFAAKYFWMDGGKYVLSRCTCGNVSTVRNRRTVFEWRTGEQYFEIVSEPKKLKTYDAPHALSAEATRDRIAFLAELSFKPPDAKAIAAIPALVQPLWPRPPQ